MKALKISWDGAEEFIPFDFDNLESNKGIIRSVERWREKNLPQWVNYLASSEVSREGMLLTFRVTYKQSEQEDSFAKRYATWGITTITFDEASDTWSARWNDDEDRENDAMAEIVVSEMPQDIPLNQRPKNIPTKPKNQETLTRFLSSLRCDLRLGYYWSAKSDDDKRVIFMIWDDQIEDGKYMLLPPDDADWGRLPGAYEVRRHIPIAMQDDVEVFGVRCHATDLVAKTRERAYHDEKSLLTLKIVQEGNAVFAVVTGEVDVARARVERILGPGAPRQDAMWDLDVPPPGAESPERKFGMRSTFSRDQMVREFVLNRAKGLCEYCGVPGFKATDGKPYLEAHHIVSLASSGADTAQNVIALCASDHREAHYGFRRVELHSNLTHFLRKFAS